MNYKYIITVLVSGFILCCSSNRKSGQSEDINLIIPGTSAEGYTIGDHLENKDIITYENDKNNIGGILGLNCFSDISFDSVHYNKESSIVFIKDGFITAIAGLKIERRITSDAVVLSRGIDNFILNYGNKGLSNCSSGSHKVYYYRELGIAVFNDDIDGSIDMYLIFKK